MAGLARGSTEKGIHTPTFVIQALRIRWADYQSVGVNSGEAGSGRAGAIGGAREDRPRHCKMAKVASGGWIAARIHIRPPRLLIGVRRRTVARCSQGRIF